MAGKGGSKGSIGTSYIHIGVRKKTTIGKNNSMISTSTMNKSKRQSYKKYRGQGR